ncbi:MAG TPA: RsmB/NOP family class I SAM-dependent RNA methyltransferase [Spirochaetia bacterium]|nr:RsmB/NOP family class I SAM-dependent RNA methyltransferase [Spirochaetia bacterium]
MSRRSRKEKLPAGEGSEDPAVRPAGSRKDARHGAGAFDRFYTELLGERWPVLRECLRDAGRPLALSDGLKKTYYLDEASHAAAVALGVIRGDLVLDMCAAPGGKTLVLALCAGTEGTIVANERSATRRARLLRVLDEHLPPEIRVRVSVTGHDARRWGLHEKNRFDRVLLDAPCSSESHVLSSPEHLARWSASRTRALAQQAHAMLAAAVDATRSSGFVLYSTCAVSPLENDGVIATLLKKRGQTVSVRAVKAPWGEPTRFGWQIMPDLCDRRGPIYFSLLQKATDPDAG